MKAERKVNIIRALKSEIDFYKRQLVPVNVVYETGLNHLRLQQMFSREEMMQMPKDMIASFIKYKMVESAITELPIETEFDEHFGVYRANLDLWVKPKRF